MAEKLLTLIFLLQGMEERNAEEGSWWEPKFINMFDKNVWC
jgi:hypothetical protein